MPIINLFNTLKKQIEQLRPKERKTRVRNITWMMVGMFQSKSVNMSHVASKIRSNARLLSTSRRLIRLMNNPAIRVREWYAPIAKQWLKRQQESIGEIRLIVDGTKIGSGHQLSMVGLAYRKRTIPIAWTWVKQARGHSTSSKQMALLAYVHKLLPENAIVILVGDSEFGSVDIMSKLDSWKWYYVLRQKGKTLIWINEEYGWQEFRSKIDKPGDSKWMGTGYFTKSEIYPVNIIVVDP